jgi:molybdopterin molybdotransferase
MLAKPVPLISIDDARERVLQATRPLPAQTVAIIDGGGQALAQDVLAVGDVPPFACSAMDGYAIRSGGAGRRLALVGESRAGTPADHTLVEGQAIRVSTGAAIPAGATAVVAQEQTERDGDSVLISVAVAVGDHVRGAGEDMAAGSIVLDAGTVLGPIELGAAVSAGAARLAVACRPRVSVLCTGDELREPGQPLGPGEIHNSNAPMLSGLAARAGATIQRAERVPDDLGRTTAAIEQAITDSDVVILSGGVSVGPHDHVKPALAQLGVREVFWGVALQPGKPTWFGTAPDDTLVFGLPGNPVSAVVTFSLFVAASLAALQCAPIPRPPYARARLAAAVSRSPRRDQALRVTVRPDAAGTLRAQTTGAQGSHILSSLLHADALAIIPQGDGELGAGASVALHALAR